MSLISVILALVVVGVLLWLLNTYVTIIDPAFKKLINIVAIVATIIWLLWIFGILDRLHEVTVHHL
jgi:type III secretory pathway component EscS